MTIFDSYKICYCIDKDVSTLITNSDTVSTLLTEQAACAGITWTKGDKDSAICGRIQELLQIVGQRLAWPYMDSSNLQLQNFIFKNKYWSLDFPVN